MQSAQYRVDTQEALLKLDTQQWDLHWPGVPGQWHSEGLHAVTISLIPDTDMDLQPFGGDQIPVPSVDFGLGSWPAPRCQAICHYVLHDPTGGLGHHQQPLCEWEVWGQGRILGAQLQRTRKGALCLPSPCPWTCPGWGDTLRMGPSSRAGGLGEPLAVLNVASG